MAEKGLMNKHFKSPLRWWDGRVGGKGVDEQTLQVAIEKVE